MYMTVESKQPCCSTDEGRPLGTGLQERVSNHLQRLWSKAMVVSTGGKGLARTRSGAVNSSRSRLCGANRPKSESIPTVYHIVVIVSVSFPRKRGSRRPASSTRLLAVRRARSRISIRRLVWTCPSQSASQAVQA